MRHSLRLLLVCGFSLFVLWSEPALAQFDLFGGSQPTSAKKPLGIVWHTGFTEKRAMDYFRSIAKELEFDDDIPKSLLKQLEVVKEKPRRVKGTVFLLKNGFPPSWESVEFQLVPSDEVDFAALDKEFKNRFRGVLEAAELSLTEKDGIRSAVLTHKPEMTFDSVETEANEAEAESTQEGQSSPPDAKHTHATAVEIPTWTFSTHYRQVGDVLFTGTSYQNADVPAALRADLPTAQQLGIGGYGSKDAALVVDFEQIPQGLKDVGWNALHNVAGTFLQQTDNEPDALYALRRSAGDCVLEACKQLIRGLDRADGSLRLANGGQPVLAHADVSIEKGGELARSLRSLGAVRPQLPVDDDAVITLHSVWAMPKSLREVGRAFAAFLRDEEMDDIRVPDARESCKLIADGVEATIAEARFECMLKVDGTPESGPAIYGALRAEATSDLFAGVTSLLEIVPGFHNLREVESDAGQYYWSMKTPLRLDEIDARVRPERLWITADAKAVWFAFGGESAWKLVDKKLHPAESIRNQKPGRNGIFNFAVDLTRLSAQPGSKDDPQTADQSKSERERDSDLMLFALELERWVDKWLLGGMGGAQALIGANPSLKAPRAKMFVNRIARMPDAKLNLQLHGHKDGLAFRFEVGEPIGALLFARQMQTQFRMIKFFEEQSAAQMEAALEAAEPVESPGN